MVDALNRKVQEMHVASLSTFQPYLRQQIINHTAKDEMYVQIKDKLQHQIFENKYEGYKLERDKLLTYKNRIYIPNVENLRIIFMDRSNKLHVLVTQDIRRQFLEPERSIFGQE